MGICDYREDVFKCAVFWGGKNASQFPFTFHFFGLVDYFTSVNSLETGDFVNLNMNSRKNSYCIYFLCSFF